MFYWIYDIPTWDLAALLTTLCIGYMWLGILLFRRGAQVAWSPAG